MARRQYKNHFIYFIYENLIHYRRHYLLAASGVNPGTALRDLSALDSQTFLTNTQPQASGWDPDTDKYMAQLQQQSTQKIIAEGIERAHRNFDAFLEENVDLDWEVQRKKICEHFGLLSKGGDGLDDSINVPSPGGQGSFGRSTRRGRTANKSTTGRATLNRSVFGISGLQKSVIGTPRDGLSNATIFADVTEKSGVPRKTFDDRLSREKQMKYANAVQRLNQERLQENSYPIIEEFLKVESLPGGEVSPMTTIS